MCGFFCAYNPDRLSIDSYILSLFSEDVECRLTDASNLNILKPFLRIHC